MWKKDKTNKVIENEGKLKRVLRGNSTQLVTYVV